MSAPQTFRTLARHKSTVAKTSWPSIGPPDVLAPKTTTTPTSKPQTPRTLVRCSRPMGAKASERILISLLINRTESPRTGISAIFPTHATVDVSNERIQTRFDQRRASGNSKSYTQTSNTIVEELLAGHLSLPKNFVTLTPGPLDGERVAEVNILTRASQEEKVKFVKSRLEAGVIPRRKGN